MLESMNKPKTSDEKDKYWWTPDIQIKLTKSVTFNEGSGRPYDFSWTINGETAVFDLLEPVALGQLEGGEMQYTLNLTCSFFVSGSFINYGATYNYQTPFLATSSFNHSVTFNQFDQSNLNGTFWAQVNQYPFSYEWDCTLFVECHCLDKDGVTVISLYDMK